MTAAVVYRLETEDGVGMYARGVGVDASRLDYYCTPCPWDDQLLRDSWERLERLPKDVLKDVVFGFLSLRQVRRWLRPGGLRMLASKGVRLRSYMVPPGHVYRGRAQAVFFRAHAVRLGGES